MLRAITITTDMRRAVFATDEVRVDERLDRFFDDQSGSPRMRLSSSVVTLVSAWCASHFTARHTVPGELGRDRRLRAGAAAITPHPRTEPRANSDALQVETTGLSGLHKTRTARAGRRPRRRIPAWSEEASGTNHESAH